MSGGDKNGAFSVEVLKSDYTTCLLPSLPQNHAARAHTQSGLMYCGGDKDLFSCRKFSQGAWTVSHTFSTGRRWHVNWDSHPGGILLMGGHQSKTTTTQLSTTDTSSSNQWSLSFDTLHTCGIDVPGSDLIVIPGGHNRDIAIQAISSVEAYSTDGTAQTMPDLNVPRHSHACGYYYKSGNLVSKFNHFRSVVKLRQGSGKDRHGMALKVNGLKASTLA